MSGNGREKKKYIWEMKKGEAKVIGVDIFSIFKQNFNMSMYYSFRIFLSNPLQTDLFEESKENKYLKMFEKVEKLKRVEFQHYGNVNYIFHYKKLGSENYIWQLAKEQTYSKSNAGEKSLLKVQDVHNPFVFLIFNTKYQILLIQNNTSVFQDIDSVKARIEDFISRNIELDISVNIKEIIDNKEFWSVIKEWDHVSDFTFDFNPPNFFTHSREGIERGILKIVQ